MADTLDLTGEIAEAINGALSRSTPVVLGYVGGDGYAALSFRGSTQVYGPQQLALWARKRDDGFVRGITERPNISLLYYGPNGPGAKYLSIRGRAHVDPSADDTVYANMVERERQGDPDRGGVAVVIDVDSVIGFGTNGQIMMERG